jgi:hypothetical protein
VRPDHRFEGIGNVFGSNLATGQLQEHVLEAGAVQVDAQDSRAELLEEDRQELLAAGNLEGQAIAVAARLNLVSSPDFFGGLG